MGATGRPGHLRVSRENERQTGLELRSGDPRVRVEQELQRWYSNKITLMAVAFPIYATEGWAARINGSGSNGDDLTHLTIAHNATPPDSVFEPRPRIEITTSIDPYQPGELAIARETFPSRVENANRQPIDDLSDAALTLWFRAARRQRVGVSHEAPVSETKIGIDGAPEPFVTVGTQNVHWVAVRRHHDVTITIAAREIDPTRTGPAFALARATTRRRSESCFARLARSRV